ncbi:hypothetical protein ACFYRG_06515 [Streptomyces mirabilis]|uniref:hypothetical protein n=1 Tax=Streptomyces mirabilis TaxID=68239 RepID=UPI0036CFF083
MMWAVVCGAERRQVTAFERIAHRGAVHLMRRRTEDYRTHRVDPSERVIAHSRLEHGLALMQRSRDLTVRAGPSPSLWYLVLTVGRPQENSAATVRDWLRDLLDGGTGDRMPSYAGLGSAADDRGGLPRSRKEAERAPGAPLAFEDCWARAAFIRVLDPTVVADLETLTPLWSLSGYTSIRTPCATH